MHLLLAQERELTEVAADAGDEVPVDMLTGCISGSRLQFGDPRFLCKFTLVRRFRSVQ